MKKIVLAIICAFALGGCGSVKDFTASTTASYTPGGQLYYQSNKNQEGFKAHTTFDPKTGALTALDIETKATTPEAAITATLDAQKSTLDAFNKLMSAVLPILIKGAATAAGGPVAGALVQ